MPTPGVGSPSTRPRCSSRVAHASRARAGSPTQRETSSAAPAREVRLPCRPAGCTSPRGPPSRLKARARGTLGTLQSPRRTSFLSTRGSVVTRADKADGGNIHVTAPVVRLQDSQITDGVVGGAGNGGNVTMDTGTIALNHSQVQASAVGGNGGHIRIASGVLLTDAGTCPAQRCLDASSGEGLPGTVVVEAPET